LILDHILSLFGLTLQHGAIGAATARRRGRRPTPGTTKCVKPLIDLVNLKAKSSRSTNQNCPCGRLSTQSDEVAEWFDALCHNTRQVIHRRLYPRLLREAAFYDVARGLLLGPMLRRCAPGWTCTRRRRTRGRPVPPPPRGAPRAGAYARPLLSST
jgi:hypothetical protein